MSFNREELLKANAAALAAAGLPAAMNQGYAGSGPSYSAGSSEEELAAMKASSNPALAAAATRELDRRAHLPELANVEEYEEPEETKPLHLQSEEERIQNAVNLTEDLKTPYDAD